MKIWLPNKINKKVAIFAGVILVLISGVFFLGKNLYAPQSAAPKPTVIPTATAEVTANWKTYNDKDYTFTFKYPQDWNVNNDKNGFVISGGNNIITFQSSPYPSIDFDKLYNKPDGTVDKNPVFVRTKIKNLEIDGYRATMFSNENASENQNKAYDINVYVISGAPITLISARVDFNSKGIFLQTFDQILSTFKFTQ